MELPSTIVESVYRNIATELHGSILLSCNLIHGTIILFAKGTQFQREMNAIEKGITKTLMILYQSNMYLLNSSKWEVRKIFWKKKTYISVENKNPQM